VSPNIVVIYLINVTTSCKHVRSFHWNYVLFITNDPDIISKNYHFRLINNLANWSLYFGLGPPMLSVYGMVITY